MGVIPHVQLFDVARTAHFERIARSGSQTTMLYARRRYDFDDELARTVGAIRAGTWAAAVYALRHDIAVLEVAEPLAVTASFRSLAVIAAVRLRSRWRRRRAVIVAYAIENKDPADVEPHLSMRARLSWRARRRGSALVWRSLDRVAFGTSQAAALYRDSLRPGRVSQRTIPALPAATTDAARESTVRPPRVVFLGDFSERKGFPRVLAAWPGVVNELTDARLSLLGKGAGTDEAQMLADVDPTVRLVRDPSRSEIFRALAAAKVLVLPSQPLPLWREQVGLPIVEALANGCEIVTSDQTGLAPWLREHGHQVVEAAADGSALIDAVLAALRSERTPSRIVAALPAVDGRHAAEQWLLTSVDPTGPGVSS